MRCLRHREVCPRSHSRQMVEPGLEPKSSDSQLGEQLRCLEVQGELRRELLQDLSEFLRRRAEVELEYSRGLERLAERFSSRVRGNKELQSFRKDQNLLSSVHCWYMLLNQTRQESRDHGVLSEMYGTSLTPRLLHISEDVGRLVKKSKDLEQHLQEELLKVVSELQTVGEVRVELELRDEVLPRAQNMQTRLDSQNIETEEVNKTLKATLQALLDLVATEDGDVLDAFQSSQSTESLKSTGSDSGSRHGSGGRRRAQQQETESFYLTKLQQYLSGRSILTKLQAKHERLQEAIQRGVKEEREVSRAHSGAGKSQRSRRQRPSSQYNHKLFAGDMEKFIQSSGQAVPLVVESCIRFINLHGLQHEGIFRVPGAQVRVTEIRSAFERGEDPLLDGYTAHDLDSVAGVLKLYFRGLETPLFPPEMFEQLLATVQLEAPSERVEYVKTMMSQLPSPILVVLRYLFAFLNHLSQYSDENMMDPYNLAVCFGPTLVSVPPDQDPVAVQAHVNEVVKTLILQQEHVFPGPRQLPGPIYEKCMTLAEEDFGDSQLEPTAEEAEQELQSETPGSEDESEVVEATARFDYVGRTAQELSFQRGDVLQLHLKASGDWWRGERAGVHGLIPHKYITLLEG
uniref:Rho GTPase activating protein 4 n=1 Tax=Ornithorhynchus anatinus TaxID=9258 RepID=A0A6I8NES6_ORNAN